jgi:hypothetical protein
MADQALKPLDTGEVRLRVHGRQGSGGDRVPASVFAQKLGALVRALRAADAAVNGRATHDYVIIDLKMGSALVELREQEILVPHLIPGTSGVSAFEDCINAIQMGSVERAQIFGRCPNYVSQLANGSGNRFGYAELWVDKEQPLRVDAFLLEQTRKVIEGPQIIERRAAPQKWYKGIAHGAFEGVVKEVDLRGALPEVKLVLTAGEKQIDCIFRNVEMDRIREALDRRVRVEGMAYYDGNSGLPRRLEVGIINIINEPGNFRRWKGTFEPFVAPEWEADVEHE